MADLWLRFRDDINQPTFQFRTVFDLNRIALVAGERREFAAKNGEMLQNAIAYFAKRIVSAVDGGGDKLTAERAAAELVVPAYLWLTEHMHISHTMLEGATLECALDSRNDGAIIHLATPSNPLDPRIMSFSVHVDTFLADQRASQAAANTALGNDAVLIDELASLYTELINGMSCNVRLLHPLLVGFAMSLRADVAPAVALAMSGRVDAAGAIARRGLEIAGFARIIASDADALEIWIQAHDDKNAWKTFKKRFSLEQLFPKGDAFWEDIYARYDELAKMHHPNPLSFSRMEWEPTADGKLMITARQTQRSVEEAMENVGEVWAIAEIFAMCLAAIELSVRNKLPPSELRVRIADLIRDLQGKVSAPKAR